MCGFHGRLKFRCVVENAKPLTGTRNPKKLRKIVSSRFDGNKRVLYRLFCKVCCIPFYIPFHFLKERKYCSQKCQWKAFRRRIVRKCTICKKIIYIKRGRFKANKSKVFFCSHKHKDIGQRLDSNLKKMWPSHYGRANGIYSYRSQARYRLPEKCVGCGFKFLALLLVHHRDGNRNNNSIKNLEFVCPTCHGLRHMKKVNNRWVWDFHSLTPINKIGYLFRRMKKMGPWCNGNTSGRQSEK